MKTRRYTPLQSQVMDLLWRDGPLSVYALRDRMPGIPYSTIHMTVRRLERKGAVRRGRQFEFEPATRSSRLGRG